jgi:hypothetical protein
VFSVHTTNPHKLAGRVGLGTARRLAALGLAAALSLAAGCSSMHPAKEEAPKGDPIALGVVAEIALEKGDCKTASETYARAAELTKDAALARHATLVALKCEHLPAAWQAVSRWHALEPNSAEADARYAAVAVKLYRLSEARAAINDFSHAPPPPPVQKQASPKSTGKGSAPTSGADSPAKESPLEDSDEAPGSGGRPGGGKAAKNR